jgi:hypothetical protein
LRQSAGLEKWLRQVHVWGMENVHKCASVLRPLIEEGHTNGVPLAERAINEMVATTPVPQHRDALESVRTVVNAHRQEAGSGPQCDFADTVNDYIEKLIRDLI